MPIQKTYKMIDDDDCSYQNIQIGGEEDDEEEEEKQEMADDASGFGRAPMNIPYIDKQIRELQENHSVSHDSHSSSSTRRRRGSNNMDPPPAIPVSLATASRVIRNNPDSSSTTHEELVSVTDPGCWGCQNGILSAEMQKTAIPGFGIMNAIVKRKLYTTGLPEIVNVMKLTYEKHIKPVMYKGKIPYDWTKKEIQNHLEDCVCDPAIAQRVSIHQFNTLKKILFASIGTQNINDISSVDLAEKKLKLVIEVDMHIHKLYAIDTRKSAAFAEMTTPAPKDQKPRTDHLNR